MNPAPPVITIKQSRWIFIITFKIGFGGFLARIGVVGTGYVGSVTAACFAELGNEVVCIDIDRKKVEAINEGKAVVYEPGLDELVKRNVRAGRLSASTEFAELADAEFSFICTGTPPKKSGETDLSQVRSAADSIARATSENKKHIAVVKSTVPPGTTEALPIKKVCMNPEFLREGKAVEDFMNPDRIVVGGRKREDIDAVLSLYKPLKCKNVMKTDLRTAEMIKYASNAFLATKISFINEIANICEKLGIDVYEVAEGVGYDKRIGRLFLNAGIGWGGSCFGKDIKSLIFTSKKKGCKTSIMDAVVKVNDSQPYRAVELAEKLLGKVKGKKICVLGLAFKPETDDVRDAPSLKIIRALVKKGARVKAYDPKAIENARKEVPSIEYAKSVEDCIVGVDCCIIATEWSEFSKISARKFKELMRGNVVVDGRRILKPEEFEREGLRYAGIGWRNIV
ncbi:MAG: UDP-glucose/GDP-mannose dehydrogenase family protein [Candidatus Micrarchaeia archaeon]